jgi:hypothetical protein
VSNDPDFEAKKNRVLELYDLADGTTEPGPSDPSVVLCVDEFGLVEGVEALGEAVVVAVAA